MKGKRLIRLVAQGICAMYVALLCGCTSIYEELEPCKLYLQFKYDYNMLYADAFPQQVDKVEVFLFDNKGVFVKSLSQTGAPLQDAGYRMPVEIEPGTYTAVVWAGHHDSYAISPLTAGVSTTDDLQLRLKFDDTRVWNTGMEDLWHGTPVQFTFSPAAEEVVTLPLVRNTNRIRLIMKDVNATETEAMTADDFNITLTAANACYDYRHNIVASPVVTYAPYYQQGDSYAGVAAELNTMRLLSDQDCRLSITDTQTGKSVLGDKMPDIDLIKCLLLTKMEHAQMSDQEYLDREYEWKVMVFYQKEDAYVGLKIMVNDWTVWQQEVEL